MDDDAAAVIIGLLVFIFLMTIVLCTAIFTHESHLRDLRYAHSEMIACITKGNDPHDCRDMVYGRGG